MTGNELLDLITSRRSVRKYTGDQVPVETIIAMLEAGRWAPSGLNNQPWKFAVIRDQNLKNRLADLTSYGIIIRECACCIGVFYDLAAGYNRDKDIMAIGGSIQSMLLMAHARGIGCVWLGEILNRKDAVNEILNIDRNHELMAVVAIGVPAEKPASSRKSLDSLIIASR